MTRHIIAMGGGGFSMEPDHLALDRYVIRQTRKRTPKVCFVPTASGDSDSYTVTFYSAFSSLGCRPAHLSLFRPPTAGLEDVVLDQDVIYVGGGNTRSLMALWREWGLDRIFRKAHRRGVVLAGVSAGALCWFQEGLSDSVPGRMTRVACLGLLRGSHCPHYSNQSKRRPAYRRMIAAGRLKAGLAADDGAALHFVDGKLSAVVTSRPEASAYRVRRRAAKAVEKALDVTYLGD